MMSYFEYSVTQFWKYCEVFCFGTTEETSEIGASAANGNRKCVIQLFPFYCHLASCFPKDALTAVPAESMV